MRTLGTEWVEKEWRFWNPKVRPARARAGWRDTIFISVALGGILSASACSLFPSLGARSDAAVHGSSPAPTPSSKNLDAKDGMLRLRRVGDVTVHRFSGSYRNGALVLTERVVAREDDLWVLDLTLEEAGSAARLRVRLDAEGEVISAARLEGEREIPASLADYHALVDKTVLAADSNEGLLGTERGTCVVGPRELECETKSYKVRLLNQPATLRISSSEELPGRDVDGEIKTNDGGLVYRSELVSFENQPPSASVAKR